MSNVLPDIGASADFGLDWPTWIAAGGFGLFCLLGFYATVLLVAGTHLPANGRFLQFSSLRSRILLGFLLAATLPAVSLALVLLERATSERLATAADTLNAQAEMIAAVVNVNDPDRLSRDNSDLTQSNGARSIIVDRLGRVVFASEDSGYLKQQDLAQHAPVRGAESAGRAVFYFTHASEVPGESERFLATSVPFANGWKLLLYRPLDEIEGALLDDYAVALIWLAGALLISICLALAMVRSLSGPLDLLDASIRGFDLNLNQDIPPPPADAPREVAAVFAKLRTLDRRVRATFGKLRNSVHQGEKIRAEMVSVITDREKEIEQRTEELREAKQTLERLRREDSLTGLANRRSFAEFLARAWQTALRDKTPISILIIDIDDFKAYNDGYGHQKGDACLKLVAEAIRRAVGRASDLVSRYGGEEFIVVLGDTPLEGGLKIADNVRATVERLGVPHTGSHHHRCVTVSIGVTSTLPTPDTQPETVLVAADRAMYNAKNEGKNKVAYSTSARTGTYQSLCVSAAAGTRLS